MLNYQRVCTVCQYVIDSHKPDSSERSCVAFMSCPCGPQTWLPGCPGYPRMVKWWLISRKKEDIGKIATLKHPKFLDSFRNSMFFSILRWWKGPTTSTQRSFGGARGGVFANDRQPGGCWSGLPVQGAWVNPRKYYQSHLGCLGSWSDHDDHESHVYIYIYIVYI